MGTIMSGTKKELQQLSKLVEDTHGVEMLMCAENSSRSWGYSHSKSDHDVFFVYLDSMNNYLSPFEKSTVIERKFHLANGTEVTFTGWDLKKACQLALKSNTMLAELVCVSKFHSEYFSYLPEHNNVTSDFFFDYLANHYFLYTLAKSYLSTAKHHLVYDYEAWKKENNTRKMLKHAMAGYRAMTLAQFYSVLHLADSNAEDTLSMAYSPDFMYNGLNHYDNGNNLELLHCLRQNMPLTNALELRLEDFVAGLNSKYDVVSENVENCKNNQEKTANSEKLNDFFLSFFENNH